MRWPHNPKGHENDECCWYCNGDGWLVGGRPWERCYCGRQPISFYDAIQARIAKTEPKPEPATKTGRCVERRDSYPYTWQDVQELIDHDRWHGIDI